MGADTSIAVAVTDKTTQPLANMRQGFKGLSKEADDARQKLDNFTKQQHSLEHEVDQAAKTMREARKEYAKTNDEVSKTNFEKASQQYDNVHLNLKRVSQSAKEAEKDVLSYSSAQSKADNRAGSMGDVVKKLGAAGAAQFLGQAASDVAQTYMTSLLGDAGGTMFGSVLGGAGTGAAIGTAFGPVGTAIGAVGGAVVGAVQGAAKNAEKKDDYFKSYVQDQYNNSMQRQADELSSGITIAGSREQTQVEFAHRFGGDEAATEYLEKVKDMATQTNYTYDEITGYTKKLLTSYDKDSIFGVLMSLSDASAGLNLASSDVDMFINGLSRMRTTGKATQEYLNYFSERGLDVYQAISDKTGYDKSNIADMVTKRQISGSTAADAILDYINSTFGGLSKKLMTTYDAMVDNLKDAQDNIDAAYGQGYIEVNKLGVKSQTDFLNGSGGEEMSQAKYEMGQGKAALENKKTQLDNDVITSMQTGVIAESYKTSAQIEQLKKLAKDYKLAKAELYDAKKSGNADEVQAAQIKIGNAYAEADVLSQNEYYSTSGAKLVEQGQISLINSIQQSGAVTGAYTTAGYAIGQELTKGIQSALDHANLTVTPHVTINGGSGSGSTGTNGSTPFKKPIGWTDPWPPAPWLPKAFGMDFVPYDNYPALLHQGERVLTANQARQQNGNGAPFTISGNNFIIREESDVDKVATRIVQKLILAKLLQA